MARVRRSSLHATAYLYFETVARLGSVRKAAAELHVVPSAVSYQITQLEAELNVPLFHRVARGVQLTSAGETLLYHVRRAAAEVERGRDFVQSLSGQLAGRCGLACVEGVAVGPVVTALVAFWARWPGIRVGVTMGSSLRVFDAVDRGEADLGLAYATADSPRVKELARADLALGAIFRADHPLARRKTLRLRELKDAGLPLLLPDPSIGVRGMLEHALGRDALRLMPRLETNSVLMMSRLALAGAGVAVKTRIGVEQELREGSAVFVPLPELADKSQRLLLFCRHDGLLSPAGVALAGALGEMVASLAAA
jgi:DNA-binding transcriptional LysR family regulator